VIAVPGVKTPNNVKAAVQESDSSSRTVWQAGSRDEHCKIAAQRSGWRGPGEPRLSRTLWEGVGVGGFPFSPGHANFKGGRIELAEGDNNG